MQSHLLRKRRRNWPRQHRGAREGDFDAYVVTAELLKSLKAEAAPEIARQLHDLYCFVQQCLNEANAKKAEKPLNDALGILTTLLEGWNGIAAAAAPREEQAASGIHAVAREKRGPVNGQCLKAAGEWRSGDSESFGQDRVPRHSRGPVRSAARRG